MSLLAIESGQHRNINAIRAQLPTFEFALSVYSYRHNSIVNVHQMDRDGGLTKGKPIPFDELDKLVSAVREKETGIAQSVSILPSNILVNERQCLVWYTPAQQRMMWFTNRQKGLRVWYPALLWACKSSRLSIVALGSNKRPTLDSFVYRAPLMNISREGALCLGGARLPKVITPQTIGDIESCLFDAKFSHLNNIYTSEPEYMQCDKAHIKYWVDKEKQGNKWSVKEGTRLGRFGHWLKQQGIM